jgi:hypothetical protein
MPGICSGLIISKLSPKLNISAFHYNLLPVSVGYIGFEGTVSRDFLLQVFFH